MEKQVALSTSTRTLLKAAASREDRLAIPPHHLPIAAQRSVVQSLLKAGLIAEIDADDVQPTSRTAETGERYTLQATDAGMAVVGRRNAVGDNPASNRKGNDTSDTVVLKATTAVTSLPCRPRCGGSIWRPFGIKMPTI